VKWESDGVRAVTARHGAIRLPRFCPRHRRRTDLDLGLRLDDLRPGGRLQPSKIHETMRLQVSMTAPNQEDSDVQKWLQQAYAENS
jgi:hypothetical protein